MKEGGICSKVIPVPRVPQYPQEQTRMLITHMLLLNDPAACCFPERGSWEVWREQASGASLPCHPMEGKQQNLSVPSQRRAGHAVVPRKPEERPVSWARRNWLEKHARERTRGRGSSGEEG